jgi:hypothetical protein
MKRRYSAKPALATNLWPAPRCVRSGARLHGSRRHERRFRVRMRLADIVDLEAQLAQDEGLEREEVRARNRALVLAVGAVPKLGGDPGRSQSDGGVARPRRSASAPALAPPHLSRRATHALLETWLRALREREPQRLFPGHRVAATLRGLAVVLALVGALLGWSTARLVLAYDGSQPVNVWDVLLVFVGVQLVLLTLLLGSFVFPVASVGVPLLGTLRALTAALWHKLAWRAPLNEERRAVWAKVLSRLRARHRLYADIEAWSLLALTQTFGVAFNVGAFIAFVRLVVFTDLAFAWSTTLDVDPERFRAIVQALATPWAHLVPAAVPSAALVDATRWSRLAGAYLGGGSPVAESVHAGGWWPFLVAALVTYGLLPRLVALVVAFARRSWLLSHLPFSDLEVRGLFSGLVTPVLSTRTTAREPAAETSDPALPNSTASLAGMRSELVLWRDMPADGIAEAVRRQLGAEVAAVREAGGRDAGALERVMSSLAADAVVVAAEAWEPPDDAVLDALKGMRSRLGTRPIVVLLAGVRGAAPARGDAEVWSRRLARLADPHLAVESLREAVS